MFLMLAISFAILTNCENSTEPEFIFSNTVDTVYIDQDEQDPYTFDVTADFNIIPSKDKKTAIIQIEILGQIDKLIKDFSKNSITIDSYTEFGNQWVKDRTFAYYNPKQKHFTARLELIDECRYFTTIITVKDSINNKKTFTELYFF